MNKRLARGGLLKTIINISRFRKTGEDILSDANTIKNVKAFNAIMLDTKWQPDMAAIRKLGFDTEAGIRKYDTLFEAVKAGLKEDARDIAKAGIISQAQVEE
jgi:hypothetical protein